MKRGTALAAVFAIFLVGLAGGVAGTRLFYSQKLEAKSERVPFLAPHYMGRLDKALDLTPEQRRAVDRILEETHREAEVLRREVRPRIHELMEGAQEKIKEVLTPEQRRRFEELPVHRRRWRGPRGPRRPGKELGRGKPGRPPAVYPGERRPGPSGEPIGEEPRPLDPTEIQ